MSAWSKEDGFCLGQRAVCEKSNEITAIPELLEKLQIKGQIITIDAMGTQTAIAEKIRNRRGDYVLALKGNQGTLHAEVGDYFSDAVFQKNKKGRELQKTQEKPHSQIETREYYQSGDIRWLTSKKEWKGLKSVVMEKKTLEKGNEKKTEYRYFISSLPCEIETVAKAVRGHWSVESMHWQLV